ncbi:hypothetical protein AXF42_Ash008845 [Apostasia shenzhenica]|uniref:RNase H type-1 domain-containing protein n=1 Tax=Apostasia shenzhenica TaxID=1088818 RepID=A0A2I0ASM7_9ASPA|nr:hypothetical protein AXF42_Ash008845 [Apostasia shenzhenica]
MGATLHQAVTLQFKATNNQVEYEALIAGLNFALSMAVKCIQVFSDSQLVVNLVNRAFKIKDEILKKISATSLVLNLSVRRFLPNAYPQRRKPSGRSTRKGGAPRPPPNSSIRKAQFRMRRKIT